MELIIIIIIIILIIIIIMMIIISDKNNEVKIYWDREIRTDVKINANRPDLILYNKEKSEVTITDVAMPLTSNIQETYTTKISKYNELAQEIKKMCKVKTVQIQPVIVSATGLVPYTLIQQLSTMGIEHLIRAIQKAVILEICHITRRFLNHEDHEAESNMKEYEDV
jgi:ABC-type anion transport system duplicated permease subunit